jgi:uncharacterized membrane protein
MPVVLEIIQLVLIGLLAGEELVVRYGVQPAMDSLPEQAHLRTRIALVKRLKVVVPVLMLPAVAASIALLLVAADGNLAWRAGGMAALIGFLLFSFLGTVPINMKVNDWDAENPPADWRSVVRRWESIDTFRSAAAILAFALFAVAAIG